MNFMAHINKVLQSIETPDGWRCVDVFVRPDGSFGFEEYRRDLEDGHGWFPIGFHGDKSYNDETAARAAAREAVAWLGSVVEA